MFYKVSRAALSNVIKTFATNVATGAPLSPHMYKYCITSRIDRTFSSQKWIRKFQLVSIYQKVVITELCMHILLKTLKTAKNMKLKK
jgi:hypothetical protein